MENIINSGWIEVISGCMFGGKSEELIKRLNRMKIARKKIQVFHPEIDTRYSDKDIVSHNKEMFPSKAIKEPREILGLVESDTEVVGIDEAQFFGEEIVEVCDELANRGLRVIVAGLDQDYRGKPFGCMPALLAIAEYVTKVRAICTVCGNPASKSKRLVEGKGQILIGEKESYTPVCRKCYFSGAKPGNH